ncbi:hypothetical protein CDAR_279091 [Caerostris darwini]|uniref:Histone-lysine N-methyltransferase SETMAR n=1 Tax=Caerostris darwini TaxID=1538125 RepID=A0AAV4T025_9ARAC|nr:hypothetical protein CDAR_279091 [Caerostris darwini]
MLVDNFNVDHSTKRLHKKNRIVFHHDNARPFVERLVVECIANNGWELLPHPPYSPTEAPTHYTPIGRSCGGNHTTKECCMKEKIPDPNSICQTVKTCDTSFLEESILLFRSCNLRKDNFPTFLSFQDLTPSPISPPASFA